MISVLGLDIGGANTKGCYLEVVRNHVLRAQENSIYHEMWRNPEGLRDVLINFRDSFKRRSVKRFDGIALTMTAELCDSFESKAQGVSIIIRIVEEVFADVPLYVWTTQEEFALSSAIKKEPLQAAAANWLASAVAIAHSSSLHDKPVIFADMGSTTADILPIASGKVLSTGRTDTERLLSGELLYTGVLRTAVHSIIDSVYLDGFRCHVVNEYFAISADVYRLLGLISEKDYDVPTPDGKSRDAEACAKRLARVVAAEPEELGIKNICLLAHTVMEKQTEQIMDNILRIVSRREVPLPKALITAGQGSFILREVARRLGWSATPWWKMIPGGKPQLAMTSYAVAWLLSQQFQKGM